MGKSSRRRQQSSSVVIDGEVPVVGLREPCPCGSGKRYKMCHGRSRHEAAAQYVARPFEGLQGECDWVALREMVPSATGTVTTTAEYGSQTVNIATVLPMAWPAMRRADGTHWVGLQTTENSGDAGRDVAAALLAVLELTEGGPVEHALGAPGSPRLKDVLVDAPFVVTLHDNFDYWLEGVQDLTADVKQSLEQANSAIMPTARLTGVESAYWVDAGDRRHLRWVMDAPEEQVIDGVARLHAAGESSLGEGSRFVGSFRADGLIVPVWDLAPDATAEDVEKPAAEFGRRLADAMAVTTPLTVDERRARAGVASRQVTLR